MLSSLLANPFGVRCSAFVFITPALHYSIACCSEHENEDEHEHEDEQEDENENEDEDEHEDEITVTSC